MLESCQVYYPLISGEWAEGIFCEQDTNNAIELKEQDVLPRDISKTFFRNSKNNYT